ncbi:MAG: hypothetical protein RL701_5032, partial [Pseudomonadota bacterium]
MLRLRTLPLSLVSLSLCALACGSSDDETNLRAPHIGCEGCYVVNAVLTGSGDSVFVGSYTGDDGGGFLRSVEKGLWTTLTQTDNGHTITQLWAASQQLYYVVSDFQNRAEVRHLNLDTQQTETLDVSANLVWSHSETDIAVFALGTVRQFDSTRWNERRMSIGKPVAVAGRSRDALYV